MLYRHGKKKERLVLESPNKLDAMKQFQKMEVGVIVTMKEVSEPFSMKVQKIIDRQKDPIKKKRIPIESYIAAIEESLKVAYERMEELSCPARKRIETSQARRILPRTSSMTW